MDITVRTNTSESLVTGRNGVFPIIEVRIWEGDNGKLFIDGIGRSGKVLNAGFVIDAEAAKKLLAKVAENKFDIDAN